MSLKSRFPFRVGTTSYILHDDLLPNVDFLADKVEDVQLLLFEVDGLSSLPDAATASRLRGMAEAHGLGYTVHLPLDLEFGCPRRCEASVEKAVRCVRSVDPVGAHSFVLHLPGEVGAAAATRREWADCACRSLEALGRAAGSMEVLAVENLERFPLDFLDPVLERLPVSLCADVGHLLYDCVDPLPFLRHWAGRVRVVHLHGIAGRDHKSIGHIPPAQLDGILRTLADTGFGGTLVMEVFGLDDFNGSVAAMQAALGRGIFQNT